MHPFFWKQLDLNRRAYEHWLDRREKQYAFPVEIQAEYDIPYLSDGGDCHRMDVFYPKQRTGLLPAALNFHGGGLLLCTRHVNRPFCAELARQGFVVFNVDYPLLPEKDACGILRDVCDGIRYAEGLLDRFGADPDRLFLTGDSAGAYLALYAAAAQKDPAIAAAAGMTPGRIPVKAMGFVSGMFDTVLCDDPGLFLRGEFYGADWRSHPMMPYLRPDRPEVASLLPPTILVTSGFDKLRSASLRLYRGLQQAGIPSRLLDFPPNPRLRHDFVVQFPEKKEGAEAVRAIAEFLHQNV